jgi:uncharacterized repeat protein (TIGR03803 family)
MASASLVGAQTLQTICSFSAASGAYPNMLTRGNDGNFYGTTPSEGGYGQGTFFQVTPSGTLTTLVSFNNTLAHLNALTLGNDGNFYGTTIYGGNGNYGTIFQATTNGTMTTLASFSNTNGARPYAALALQGDGSFYGTTDAGGITNSTYTEGMGTVFKVTTNGSVTTLVSFNYENGANPAAGLTMGNDGSFYGTTADGGSGGYGTVFKVTTNGTMNTLVSFSNTNGGYPVNALTLGVDGSFYSTTYASGSGAYGTVYRVTTNGSLTTLVSFNNDNESNPNALTLGNDGNFYGTTYGGANGGDGTIFQVAINGTMTTLVSFSNTNGAHPQAALTLGNDGNFYGTTRAGGSSGYGTVFRLLVTPVIAVQPYNQVLSVGATVTFLVSATGLNPISYQWQKNGTNLMNGGKISGATTNAITIDGISDNDAASYSVVVQNAFGSVTSSNALLTVNDLPLIASQPQSLTVVLGSNVTFSVTVYGTPPFVFQWYFNGTPLGSPTTATNLSSCTVTNVGTNQAGNYSVVVVNGYGSSTSSNAALTVVGPPAITAQPTSRTNSAGTTATFSVVVSSLSATSYQWQKNSANLLNGGNVSGATNSTLTIASVSDNDAAIYSVTVANLAGITPSSNATLTVIDPPVITAQPLGQRIFLGGYISFNVSVINPPPLHYQWRFNGVNLLNATNAAYAIQAVAATNTGNYSVVVTNLAGSAVSSNALLTVVVPPTLGLRLGAGYPLLNLNGMLSSNFVVQYSTNLVGTNWIHLLSLTNLPSSPYPFLDPAGVVKPGRFYRAFMW